MSYILGLSLTCYSGTMRKNSTGHLIGNPFRKRECPEDSWISKYACRKKTWPFDENDNRITKSCEMESFTGIFNVEHFTDCTYKDRYGVSVEGGPICASQNCPYVCNCFEDLCNSASPIKIFMAIKILIVILAMINLNRVLTLVST